MNYPKKKVLSEESHRVSATSLKNTNAVAMQTLLKLSRPGLQSLKAPQDALSGKMPCSSPSPRASVSLPLWLLSQNPVCSLRQHNCDYLTPGFPLDHNRSADYSPRVKSDPPNDFVNKVLLEHSNTHSWIIHSHFILQYRTDYLQQKLCGLHSLKYLLAGCLQKFANLRV